jgi:lactoylglutathione lyase
MIMFIIYVVDQERTRVFYETVLDRQPVLNVPGMTEFMLAPNCKLGIMPEEGIARILTDKAPHPATGNGIPRCELYYYPDDIEACIKRLALAGAVEISPFSDRDWGDAVGYFSDPDGHIVAIARKL